MLKDKAMAQNLIYFGQREHEQREQTRGDDVATLAAAIGGTAPPPTLPAEQQPTEAATMEVTEQSDGKMADRTEAQQSGSKGLATEDASNA